MWAATSGVARLSQGNQVLLQLLQAEVNRVCEALLFVLDHACYSADRQGESLRWKGSTLCVLYELIHATQRKHKSEKIFAPRRGAASRRAGGGNHNLH